MKSFTSGEGYFFSKIIERTKDQRVVIFDVGANVGEYTKMALDELKANEIVNYEIHLFEPQKECYQILCDRFKDYDYSTIKINNFALSDSTGLAIIHSDFHGGEMASLFDRQGIGLLLEEEIRTKTLSEYIVDNNIDKISLLKIDVEGSEKKVLCGGGDFIRPFFVEAIQFEYGGTYLDAGITLVEVAKFLMDRAYSIGKLTPDKIEFKNELNDFVENYGWANYVAISARLKQ